MDTSQCPCSSSACLQKKTSTQKQQRRSLKAHWWKTLFAIHKQLRPPTAETPRKLKLNVDTSDLRLSGPHRPHQPSSLSFSWSQINCKGHRSEADQRILLTWSGLLAASKRWVELRGAQRRPQTWWKQLDKALTLMLETATISTQAQNVFCDRLWQLPIKRPHRYYTDICLYFNLM